MPELSEAAYEAKANVCADQALRDALRRAILIPILDESPVSDGGAFLLNPCLTDATQPQLWPLQRRLGLVLHRSVRTPFLIAIDRSQSCSVGRPIMLLAEPS